jgi:predicted RNA-binding Zn-ribbon protein involved in translation (DUF1610 family)
MNDYTAAWDDYRRRAGWFYLLWLGGVVVIAVGTAISRRLLGDDKVVAWILGLAWMIGFVITGYRKTKFPCPRCGNPFFMRLFWTNAFARKCVHCRLPKWERATKES